MCLEHVARKRSARSLLRREHELARRKLEGRIAEEDLGEHAAERPDVDLGIPRAAEDHLGRTVPARLQVGHVHVVLENGRAEVDELKLPRLGVGDADVGRLDVTVRDAVAGAEIEGVEHLRRERANRSRVVVVGARVATELLEVHVVREERVAQELGDDEEVLARVEEVEHAHDVPPALGVFPVDERVDADLAEARVEAVLLVAQDLDADGLVLVLRAGSAVDGREGALADVADDPVAAWQEGRGGEL